MPYASYNTVDAHTSVKYRINLTAKPQSKEVCPV
jgi:hypothetical protein